MTDERDALLWSLRARRSVAKCVLRVEPPLVELVVLQDEDIAVRERFPDEDIARARAGALHESLRRRGWRDAS